MTERIRKRLRLAIQTYIGGCWSKLHKLGSSRESKSIVNSKTICWKWLIQSNPVESESARTHGTCTIERKGYDLDTDRLPTWKWKLRNFLLGQCYIQFHWYQKDPGKDEFNKNMKHLIGCKRNILKSFHFNDCQKVLDYIWCLHRWFTYSLVHLIWHGKIVSFNSTFPLFPNKTVWFCSCMLRNGSNCSYCSCKLLNSLRNQNIQKNHKLFMLHYTHGCKLSCKANYERCLWVRTSMFRNWEKAVVDSRK